MKVRRIPELESLRGLMALWVMLGHVYLTLPRADLPLLGAVLARNGEAVNVFIILSGFVIFNLLDHERRGFRPYIIRRFFRIFPAYLLLLLVSAALLGVAEAAFSDPLWRSARNDGRLGILADTRAHFEAHMLAHLLLLQGMVPSRLLPSAEYAILGQAGASRWSGSSTWSRPCASARSGATPRAAPWPSWPSRRRRSSRCATSPAKASCRRRCPTSWSAAPRISCGRSMPPCPRRRLPRPRRCWPCLRRCWARRRWGCGAPCWGA
jgi:hypothetical protein